MPYTLDNDLLNIHLAARELSPDWRETVELLVERVQDAREWETIHKKLDPPWYGVEPDKDDEPPALTPIKTLSISNLDVIRGELRCPKY